MAAGNIFTVFLLKLIKLLSTFVQLLFIWERGLVIETLEGILNSAVTLI